MREFNTENVTLPKLLWNVLTDELHDLRSSRKVLHRTICEMNIKILKLQEENTRLETVIKELCDLIKDSY